MVNELLRNLRSLRKPNGLYIASTGQHYVKVWIRDCFYESLPELEYDPEKYMQTYRTLLDLHIGWEKKYKKFHYLIADPKNKQWWEYSHPRCTVDLEQIEEEWGTKQWDTFGEFLYGIYLGESAGLGIIRGEEDRWIINLMIKFLEAIEYWKEPDNGIWEEVQECRASSVGACVAGLTAIRQLGFEVPQWLIDKGHETLNKLLPKETETRDCDLALLTLIYPFNIVDTFMGRWIIKNIEENLKREMGVIRYEKDQYYINGILEAEWTFGFSFLALAHETLGNWEQANTYRELVKKTVIDNYNIPELFYGGTTEPNPNNPLGWSLAMAILVLR